jgi:2-phosphosulfolactate phosphatase
MNIAISQGRTPPAVEADITIVIDVIRAFTVAHYAFRQGVKQIYLVETAEQAFDIKEKHPEVLLAGEERGLAIEGFDFDNSPTFIQLKDLVGKTLVQRTTNGVRATLNCLDSKHLFVTGFSNARNTATYIKDFLIKDHKENIHLIASHPSGDDDLACAEYVRSILLDKAMPVKEVVKRIKSSHAAQKFYDKNKPEFPEEDMVYCTRVLETDFVMKVNKDSDIPLVERIYT